MMSALALPILAIVGWIAFKLKPLPAKHELRSKVRTLRRASVPVGYLSIIGAERQRHMIRQGQIRIGRQDDNDICLNDGRVHRYHAVVHRGERGRFEILSLASSADAGLRVNGRKVAACELSDGDVVQIGGVELRFEAPEIRAGSHRGA